MTLVLLSFLLGSLQNHRNRRSLHTPLNALLLGHCLQIRYQKQRRMKVCGRLLPVVTLQILLTSQSRCENGRASSVSNQFKPPPVPQVLYQLQVLQALQRRPLIWYATHLGASTKRCEKPERHNGSKNTVPCRELHVSWH